MLNCQKHSVHCVSFHHLRSTMSSRWTLKHRWSLPWRNLRYVKWGPRGGRWVKEFHTVAAHGPPPTERRPNIKCCWLCNAELQEHHRKWNRPEWSRRSRVRRVVDLDGRVCNVRTSKTVPTSQLDMTIYCCLNGCDADDALQSLLDQTDHTGPRYAPRPRVYTGPRRTPRFH